MNLAKEEQEFFAQYGVPIEEVERQRALLTNQPQRVHLERACTVGDGIHELTDHEVGELRAIHRESAEQGRWVKFIPASGAASRMFALRSDDDKQRFAESFGRLAFASTVRTRLAEMGVNLDELLAARRFDDVADAVLSPEGAGYGGLPKGLVEFHDYRSETRTPFEEHLLVASRALAPSGATADVHFTVAADCRELFEERMRQFSERHGETPCDVGFSVQHPSTDTIVLADNGDLIKDDEGNPVLRPGGHGSLIQNLNDVQGDLIFVKNVDNVGHEHTWDASLQWIQTLGGYLIRLQDQVHRQLRALQNNGNSAVAGALELVRRTFPNAVAHVGDDPVALREELISCLRRPLRVCGMVKNEGEPGGGPYWVREAAGGISAQIIESAEVNSQDPVQQKIFKQATHFNPVFMALGVRDEEGRPYDLWQFVEQGRAIITRKPMGDKTVTVLERPGLWNGGMAKWNSVFIEVPSSVFSPVKTVFDLLRPQHQP